MCDSASKHIALALYTTPGLQCLKSVRKSAVSGKPNDRRAFPPDPRDQGRLVCTGIAENVISSDVARMEPIPLRFVSSRIPPYSHRMPAVRVFDRALSSAVVRVERPT